MQKSFIILIGLAMLSFNAYAGTHLDITGTYECKGHDPFVNIDYSGKTTVKLTGNTYDFTWDYGNKMYYIGTGIFNGSDSQNLGVVFKSTSEDKYTGIQMYQIQRDGSLVGSWTLLGKQEVGSEVCKKLS